jgi:hypothetical protein
MFYGIAWNRIKAGFSNLRKAIIVIRFGDVICLTPYTDYEAFTP